MLKIRIHVLVPSQLLQHRAIFQRVHIIQVVALKVIQTIVIQPTQPTTQEGAVFIRHACRSKTIGAGATEFVEVLQVREEPVVTIKPGQEMVRPMSVRLRMLVHGHRLMAESY